MIISGNKLHISHYLQCTTTYDNIKTSIVSFGLPVGNVQNIP